MPFSLSFSCQEEVHPKARFARSLPPGVSTLPSATILDEGSSGTESPKLLEMLSNAVEEEKNSDVISDDEPGPPPDGAENEGGAGAEYDGGDDISRSTNPKIRHGSNYYYIK